MKNILIGLALIIIAIGTGMAGAKLLVPKTAYIELDKVFSGFEMKVELEKKLGAIRAERKALTDSLELELQIIARQLQGTDKPDKDKINEFQVKKERFMEKRDFFEEDNRQTANRFDEQIFNQLNQYVKDYGEKNNYAYVFGAEGSGVIMYGEASKNITEEVIAYINERYRGKSK